MKEINYLKGDWVYKISGFKYCNFLLFLQDEDWQLRGLCRYPYVLYYMSFVGVFLVAEHWIV